jgi:hypothetical protein
MTFLFFSLDDAPPTTRRVPILFYIVWVRAYCFSFPPLLVSVSLSLSLSLLLLFSYEFNESPIMPSPPCGGFRVGVRRRSWGGANLTYVCTYCRFDLAIRLVAARNTQINKRSVFLFSRNSREKDGKRYRLISATASTAPPARP